MWQTSPPLPHYGRNKGFWWCRYWIYSFMKLFRILFWSYKNPLLSRDTLIGWISFDRILIQAYLMTNNNNSTNIASSLSNNRDSCNSSIRLCIHHFQKISSISNFQHIVYTINPQIWPSILWGVGSAIGRVISLVLKQFELSLPPTLHLVSSVFLTDFILIRNFIANINPSLKLSGLRKIF